MRRIGGEEAWALNTRRHGLGHRNFMAEVIDKCGEERWNTHCGIFVSMGGRGLERTKARPLKRLDLPSVLSFGAATIRRRAQ